MAIGRGSTKETLNENQVMDICAQALMKNDMRNKRVLVIIPDHSRSGPIDMMFRAIYSLLEKKVKLLDFLVALGTHPPMSEESILARVGINKKEYDKALSLLYKYGLKNGWVQEYMSGYVDSDFAGTNIEPDV